MALVLTTGMIVGNAIVVVENVQRHHVLVLKPMTAAVLCTHQLFFAIIATSETLISVFLPKAFSAHWSSY